MDPENKDMTRLCRDCGSDSFQSDVCNHCGSRRTLAHAEVNSLSIAHVDCDAFYCSVEKRDNPDIRDKPVIVGGGRRGVVSAACYHARVYGVRSAMPMFQALKLCPDAVVVKGNMSKYGYEGGRIRRMMRALTPLVEPLSIDEAFLDLTGTQRLHGRSPAQSLIQLQNDILREIGVTVSIGLSYNKFLAKTASDLDKPNGFAVLGQSDAQDFLAKQSVGFIYGIGPAFASKLEKVGLRTIADVRARSDKEMAQRFGDQGLRLARLARGEDNRRVNPVSDRKSVSAETTFNSDIADLEQLKSRFKSITRRRTLPQPVQLADVIFSTLEPLLESEVDGFKSFRLIGAGISGLSEPVGDVADMLDEKSAKRGAAERASDIARAKFGSDAVTTGRGLRLRQAKEKNKAEPTEQTES